MNLEHCQLGQKIKLADGSIAQYICKNSKARVFPHLLTSPGLKPLLTQSYTESGNVYEGSIDNADIVEILPPTPQDLTKELIEIFIMSQLPHLTDYYGRLPRPELTQS